MLTVDTGEVAERSELFEELSRPLTVRVRPPIKQFNEAHRCAVFTGAAISSGGESRGIVRAPREPSLRGPGCTPL